MMFEEAYEDKVAHRSRREWLPGAEATGIPDHHYLSSALLEGLITGTEEPDTLNGTMGNDEIQGLGGNDLFLLGQGGDDVALGGNGNDSMLFGAAFTSADRIDGGQGLDTVAVQGNYVLTLAAGHLVNVETFSPMSGADARFGDNANNRYSYDITTIDENVAAGVRLIVNAAQLRPTENFVFRGSAETDGAYFVYGGQGIDRFTGGAGDDVFFMGEDARYGGGDKFNGGLGHDGVVLRGTYTVAFAADTFTSIETISFNPAADTRFAPLGANYRYTIATHDGNVSAGATVTFNGARLATTETLVLDAGQETDGHLRLFAGASNDGLTAGAGNDLLYGGLGRDYLRGGGGADTYYYFETAAESSSSNYDLIDGFDYNADRFDIPGARGASYAGQVNGGALTRASFDVDLAAAVSGHLDANTALLFTPDAGAEAGAIFLVVDANGVDGYQSNQDYVFQMVNATPPPPVGAVFVI